MIGTVLDTVLDRSIVGGYTSFGYRVRRHWWDDSELPSMTGKVVLVTGATSGLGTAAAAGFARLGATVHLLARDRSRGEDARAAVAEQAEADIHLQLCDLSRLASVREFAQRFATEVPGPLRHAAPSRIINVSSGGMYAQRLNADDLQSTRDFSGTTAYARTKRAEIVLTEMWADRLDPDRIAVNAMHPGWADTPGVRSSLPRFYRLTRPLLRTPAEGADTIVWLGAAPAGAQASGGFWHDRVRRPVHLLPTTRESPADRRQLWSECERLSGTGPIHTS
jgi:dehydrogenase/reductase SDR family protein 12